MSRRENGPPLTLTALDVSALNVASGSETMMRCGPVRKSVTGNVNWPLTSVVSGGMSAKASVDERRTVFEALDTRFQKLSTARSVSWKLVPALCGATVPSRPSSVPPRGDSSGTSTCRPDSGPGLTTKVLLVPVCGGDEKSAHDSVTAPPAPRKTMLPVQVPAANDTSVGEMLPAPVFAESITSPAKSGIVLPPTSVARMVTETGTPAICGDAIGGSTTK